MVRFIDRDKVLVASYPVHYTNGEDNISEAEYKTSKYFLDRIADVLEKHFVVNRIECAIPIINKNEEMPSSFGNYINFLRLGNIVYIPQYGIPQDANAIDKIKSIEPQLTIIKVSADIEKLAKFGGVLNCISWQYY
jgi:agmatine/peptidylarginine deiminase